MSEKITSKGVVAASALWLCDKWRLDADVRDREAKRGARIRAHPEDITKLRAEADTYRSCAAALEANIAGLPRAGSAPAPTLSTQSNP